MTTILDALRNASKNLQSDTPLDQAIGTRQVETVIQLLEAGFSPDESVEEAHRKIEGIENDEPEQEHQ